MNEWQRLSEISQQGWALVVLWQDPMFWKIPKKDWNDCIQQGIQAGLAAAEQWDLQKMQQTLQQNEIQLCCDDREGACNIHAEYCGAQSSRSGKSEINIYQKTLQKICAQAQKQKIPVTIEQLYTLHIAHEFYHYLEDTNKVDAGKTERKIEFCICRIFKQTRSIKSLREIAAHIFAQQLCNEKYHPLQWDWLLMKQQDETQAKVFYDMCLQADCIAKGVER